MPTRVSRPVFMTALGFCVALSAVPAAEAALGGNPMTTPPGATMRVVQPSASSASGAAQNQSVMRSASPEGAGSTNNSSASASWTVHETTLENGTVVREYLTQAGTVFGIAWTGPQMPNLGSLLGTYFPQYVDGLKATRAARGGRGPGLVDSSTLVVHSAGHMGAFTGQAWLPQALPAGVDGSSIQ